MKSPFKPIYEFTLQEVFSWYALAWTDKSAPARNSLERKPFFVDKKPLGDLMYQAVRTSTPIPGGLWEAMKNAEVGPSPNLKDRRTGIVVYSDNKIVGSMTDAGICNPPKYSFFVHPDYRDKGVGQATIIALWLEFPRHETLGTRATLNQYGAFAVMKAFPKYIKHCQDAGSPVPQRVIDSLKDDMEAVTARIKALKSRA